MTQKYETWGEYENAIMGHFERVKKKFRDDTEMQGLLMKFEKVLLGDFEFEWKHGDQLVIVEGLIPVAVNEEAVPTAESLRHYLVTEYPAPLYMIFTERINRYLQNTKGCIRPKDFGILRETLNNLELLSSNQMSHSIEIEGRAGEIILKLPLKIEIENVKEAPMDLWETSMFIAENFDRIFEKTKELVESSE